MKAYKHEHNFKTLVFHQKLTRIQSLHETFLKQLQSSNYKRTDSKAGKLKYSASPKRIEVFHQLQNTLTELYAAYMKDYLEYCLGLMREVDELEQRNPMHLVCLNKYQKCFVTMELMLECLENPYLVMDEDTVS